MNYITATTQQDADNACDKMWINYLMTYASNTEKLVGDDTTNYSLSDVEIMTDAQICALNAYGKKASDGTIQYTQGLTNRYTNSFIADNDPNLYIICPDPGASIMAGVVNTSTLPKDDAWWPNEEEI